MPSPSSDPAAKYFRSVFAVLRSAILLLVGLLLAFLSLAGKAANGSFLQSQTLNPQAMMMLGTGLGLLLAAAAAYLLQRATRRFLDLRRHLQRKATS